MIRALCVQKFVLLLVPAFLFVFSLIFSAPAFCEQEIPVDNSADLRGKVTDPSNAPLSRVKIRLTDSVSGESKTTSTNGEGQFWISADWPHNLMLEIEPAPKLGLAGAVFDDLPAREDRQLIVHLARGFAVDGRVTYGGNPLKGMQVRVFPADDQDEHQKIYGRAKATTGGNGAFHMLVSPGRKSLVIINERYSNIERKTIREITVTADVAAGDIDLSSKQGDVNRADR